MREAILNHKKGFTITAYIFLVFIGCFTFPVWNFTRASWYNVFIAIFAYYEIGMLFRVLYEDKPLYKVALASLCFTIIGFVCRYLLEYGEVSNTYNFTLLNTAFHTLVAVGITTLTALCSKRRSDTE